MDRRSDRLNFLVTIVSYVHNVVREMRDCIVGNRHSFLPCVVGMGFPI